MNPIMHIFSEHSDLTVQELLETDEGRWWIARMKVAGIPPLHSPAHLDRTCPIYQDSVHKESAFKDASRFRNENGLIRNSKKRSSLLLYGGVGTGKTWLATAVFKDRLAWMEKQNTVQFCVRAFWRRHSDITREVQATYSDPSTSSDLVIKKYQEARLLLIDDFGDMESGKESDDKRQIMLEILDHRNSAQLPTLLTSNLELSEMKDKWGERLFARVTEMAAVVPLQGQDLRMKPPKEPEYFELIRNAVYQCRERTLLHSLRYIKKS